MTDAGSKAFRMTVYEVYDENGSYLGIERDVKGIDAWARMKGNWVEEDANGVLRLATRNGIAGKWVPVSGARK